MTPPEPERYARHTLIPGWDQARLAAAGVVVIGLGALGNEAGRVLALSGVGRMILCDPDRVEASNLSRCALFQTADLGRYKVEAAADALRRLNPKLEISTRSQPLVHGVGLAELRDADLVLSCLDSRSARLQLAGRCNLAGAPSLDGGSHPWGGEVRPFLDPAGPCYGCGLGTEGRARADAPWSCLDQQPEHAEGATAAASALVGCWMALLALRYLQGLSTPDALLNLDGPAGRATPIQRRRDPACPLHTPLGPVQRLALSHRASLGQLLAQLPPGAVPLAWSAVQRELACRSCGYRQTSWGLASTPPCPACGQPLRPLTTLELATAPPATPLADLGIAPREILAVRSGQDMLWAELAG